MAIVFAVLKWRHYLLGRHFRVHTDQKSLKFLLDQREVALDYRKWLVKLLAFDFEIVYKPGIENRAADGLSRIHQQSTLATLCALTIPSVLQLQDIYAEIAADARIQEKIQLIRTGGHYREGLRVADDKLWYRHSLVIPSSSRFIAVILDEYHSGLVGGHEGILKTLKRIQQNFWWDKIRLDVEKFVSSCEVCQRHKYSTLSPAGLLNPLPVPDNIWTDVNLDFIEGLPLSGSMNSILVAVDRFSKAGHFLGLKHPFSAADVAAVFIKEIVRLHGFPKSIVLDRDCIFQSGFWKELFKQSGTKLKYSTAYHPQTDGQTEVLNRCLETYLRCFASSHPRLWSKFLHWAEFSYNTSYHSAIKMSPYQVMYGRPPPSLIPFERGSTTNALLEHSLVERDVMLLQIKNHLLRAQEIMKKQADQHRRAVEFAVGTRVFLKLQPYRQNSVNRRICQKLSARYFGPFEITERIGMAAYRLRLPADSKIHDVFHVSQLKEAIGCQQGVVPLPNTFSVHDEFTVEPDSVLKTRYNDTCTLEALVHWKGLADSEDSWVDAQDLVRKYPELQLGDKLSFKEGGIDIPFKVYYRKGHKKNIEKESENTGGVQVVPAGI